MKTRWIAAAVIAGAVVAAVLWRGQSPREDVDAAPESRHAAAAPPGPGAQSAPARLATTNGVGSTTAPAIVPVARARAVDIAAKYRRRGSYAALLQSALASGDALEIEYARRYLLRCVDRAFETGASEAVTAFSPSPEMARAVSQMEGFCADALQGRTFKEASAMITAGSKAAAARDGAGKPARGWHAVVEAAGARDAERMIEAFAQIPPLEKAALLNRLGAARHREDVPAPSILMAIDLGFADAVCQHLGCDADYQMAFLCRQFDACSSRDLRSQYRQIFDRGLPAASRGKGQWEFFRQPMDLVVVAAIAESGG